MKNFIAEQYRNAPIIRWAILAFKIALYLGLNAILFFADFDGRTVGEILMSLASGQGISLHEGAGLALCIAAFAVLVLYVWTAERRKS